jgi:hypothetical protein
VPGRAAGVAFGGVAEQLDEEREFVVERDIVPAPGIQLRRDVVRFEREPGAGPSGRWNSWEPSLARAAPEAYRAGKRAGRGSGAIAMGAGRMGWRTAANPDVAGRESEIAFQSRRPVPGRRGCWRTKTSRTIWLSRVGIDGRCHGWRMGFRHDFWWTSGVKVRSGTGRTGLSSCRERSRSPNRGAAVVGSGWAG